MKQRAVAIVAEYLFHRPLGRVIGLKSVADDDYIMAIEDIRDGRLHVARTPRDLEPWFKSFKTGECLQPTFGLCGRCGCIHRDRDVDGEVFPHLHPVSGRARPARARALPRDGGGVMNDKLRAAHDKLQDAVAEIASGDDWRRMLKIASKFHR